jgi:hypothetical protein
MTRMHALCLALVLLFAPCALAVPARVALVVGNSDYGDPRNNIRQAKKDAEDVEHALKRRGFTVIAAKDADSETFRAKIEEFRKAIEPHVNAEAVVYYSGHGGHFRRDNYLIPTDLVGADAAEFAKKAIAVKEIYNALQAVNPRVAIVLLDACRTSVKFHQGEVKEGLLEPKGDEVFRGLVTGFAHRPGEAVTNSADGQHSAYAKAILKHIHTPGLALADFFIEVGLSVEDYIPEQEPWQNSAQRVQFFFRDPIYLEVAANDVDDDLIVTAGLDSYVYTVDGRAKKLRLLPGRNIVTVAVVNYRSKSGGELAREGWRYALKTRIVDGPAGPNLRGAEPEQPVPHERWGRTFVVARFAVNVARDSSVIRFERAEEAVWTDGFSLVGNESDDVYQSVRWAVLYQGIPLFEDETAVPRPPEALRIDILDAHDAALEEHDRIGVANREHAQARDVIARTPDEEIEEALRRVRESISPDDIAQNLRASCAGRFRAVCAGYRGNGQWVNLRAHYMLQQQNNIESRFLLGILSNLELQELYDRTFVQ